MTEFRPDDCFYCLAPEGTPADQHVRGCPEYRILPDAHVRWSDGTIRAKMQIDNGIMHIVPDNPPTQATGNVANKEEVK